MSFEEKEIEYTLAWSSDERAFIAFAPAFNLLCKGKSESEAVTYLKEGITSMLNEFFQDSPLTGSPIEVIVENTKED